MDELRKAREETEKTRQDVGALDLKPGEVEGMVSQSGEGGGVIPQKSRALEKRKRDLEERRRMLDAKRRKKIPDSGTTPDETPVFSMPPDDSDKPAHPPDYILPKMAQEPIDPFAALEAQTIQPIGKGKEKQTASHLSDADAFLANLEHDIMTRNTSR